MPVGISLVLVHGGGSEEVLLIRMSNTLHSTDSRHMVLPGITGVLYNHLKHGISGIFLIYSS